MVTHELAKAGNNSKSGRTRAPLHTRRWCDSSKISAGIPDTVLTFEILQTCFFLALLWLQLTICFITSNTDNLWNWNLIAPWKLAIADNCWGMVTASTWREIPSRRRPSQSRFLLWFRPHPNKVTQQKMHRLCLSGFRIGPSPAFKSHTMVNQLRKEFQCLIYAFKGFNKLL